MWIQKHKHTQEKLHKFCHSLGVQYEGVELKPTSNSDITNLHEWLISNGFILIEPHTGVQNGRGQIVYFIRVYSIGHGGNAGPMGEDPSLADEPDEIVWIRLP